ncbi:hypothetical protein [Hyphomonas sp.]|uniref:hypothetical protein n=1 Tax=Hyphomonas sp. TaxID=87 RepID=UPI003D2CF51C
MIVILFPGPSTTHAIARARHTGLAHDLIPPDAGHLQLQFDMSAGAPHPASASDTEKPGRDGRAFENRE